MDAFEADSTIQITDANADGIMFVIRNSPAGINALGGSGGGLGFLGIPKSVGYKFDLHDNAGEGQNSVGVYINGAAPTVPAFTDLSSSGIDFHSGQPIAVKFKYSSGVLNVEIGQGNSSHFSFPGVDIPGAVGGATAYIGFTAETGALSQRARVLSLIYNEGNPFGPH